MLNLQTDGGWDTSENLLARVSLDGQPTELAVPNKTTSAFLGGEVSKAQVVCTWATKNPGSPVGSWALNDKQVGALVGHIPGLLAALLGRPMLSFTDGRDLGDGIANSAMRRLDDLHDMPIRRERGMKVDMVCADHLGRRSPVAVYRRDEGAGRRLMKLGEFERAVDRMLEFSLPRSHPDWFDRQDRRTAADLLYEAFRNTDEHATRGLDGARLPMSFRGFTLRHHTFMKENLAGYAEGSVPLGRFYERLQPPSEFNRQVNLLEISVFDCGLGYASHLRRRPLCELKDADEYRAVVECFEKNVSSKDRSGTGQGLALISELLSRRGGFLRLRTGRLSLCGDGEDGLQLVDAVTGRDAERRAPVCGTVLTFILPMKNPSARDP
jgi:hypothetical protein